MFKAHPLADVQSENIGENTTIWQFAIVLERAQIGANCNINCHTFIENDVIVGDNVTIKSGVHLWDGITIEDDVFIGPSVVFTNDLKPRSKQYGDLEKTIIKKGASLGANSTILAGITIGEFAMTGTASNITKDVPAHALVYGNPAKIRGWVDEHGNRLSKNDEYSWASVNGDIYVKFGEGFKKRKMNIPFLSFENRNKAVRQEVLSSFEIFFDSSWYILGERVKQFERAYAAFNKTQYCIGVSNGLDALHLSLKALGIGKGDEVIVPSNTFIATVLAVNYVGAIPVFVEPRIKSYNINPELIKSAITPRTKAIIPVHLYGQACEMDTIMEVAKKYNLFVVEDNAQAHGATWNGKLTGSFGDINGVEFLSREKFRSL